MATHTAMKQGNDADVRGSIERSVGILHFVSPKEQAWSGTTRKRYTDFQVHEITKDGSVVHLDDFYWNAREYERKHAPKPAAPPAQDSSAKPAGNAADVQAAEKESSDANNSKPSAQESSLKPTGEGVEDQSAAKESSDAKDSKPSTVEGKSSEATNSATVAASEEKGPSAEATKPQSEFLVNLFTQSVFDELTALYQKICDNPRAKPATHGSVKLPAVQDRGMRAKVHGAIREAFAGKIETLTDGDNINATAAGGGGRQRWDKDRRKGGKPAEPKKKFGKYLHFSLYKENKDTMEAIANIARVLRERPNDFQTAGTKDRRAVTVQRVSVRGRDPAKLLFLNDRIRDIKIGNFKFEEKELYLGCLKGNEFTIVMKDCVFRGAENESLERRLELGQAAIDTALDRISRNGFINYFGTQRFGTFEISTQAIGIKILNGDFEGAVADLLTFDPALTAIDTSEPKPGEFIRYDDIARAKTLAKYQEDGDALAASQNLPRRCNTEWNILKHLSKQPKDFNGALMTIPRGMRNMYLHAYQSLVWNFVASKRWELFGTSVVPGDLVLVAAADLATAQAAEDAEDEEETLHLKGNRDGDGDDDFRQKARALTQEDVDSGRYTIFDVVLPVPGSDIIYPDNEVGRFYTEFMGREENGGLDPHGMYRRQKELSLSGAYRKFMGGFIGTPTGSIRSYLHDHDQLIPTDFDIIKTQRAKAAEERAANASARGDKQSGWFNIQEDDRKRAAEVREALLRQAEEGQQDIRMNDTWIQTSLDGSSKRIKVAESTTEIGGATADNSSSNQDKMDVDKPDAVGTTVLSSKTEQTADQKADSAAAGESTTAGDVEIPATTEGAPAPVATEEPQTPTDPSGATGPAEGSTSVSQKRPLESAPPPEPKIAVILKFALQSSQYATVVLRELQG